MEGCIVGLLSAVRNRARRQPNRLAVTVCLAGVETTFNHAELLQASRRYANLYRELGAKSGDVVLIALQPGIDLYYAFLGALWVGCVPSMMPFPSSKQDPGLFWESHKTLFGHLGGGIFVTYPDNAIVVAEVMPPGLLHVVTAEQARDDSEIEPHAWREQDVCCLQHSSGTTGLKKGVPLTIGAIAHQVDSYAAAIGLEAADVIVSWLPLYHDMGFVAAFLMPLLTGNTVVMASPFDWLGDPLWLFDAIERHDARFAWLPNFAFHHLVNNSEGAHPRDLSRMKAFIDCSEPCRPETFAEFLQCFAAWGLRPGQLQVCYAMAETVFAVTQTRPGHAPRTLSVSASALRDERMVRLDADDPQLVLSTGNPIAGVEIRIDGPQAGEIQLRGPFVFDGYFGQDSAAAFVDGWYRTGDIGFMHDGELFVLGRLKDLIVVLGKNFLAHDLEALVNRVGGVKPGRAVALGVFNPATGSEDAVIVAELDGLARPTDVRSGIRAALGHTVGLVPKTILLVEPGWLVKSTSGKISRSANLRKFQDSRR